MDIIFGILVLFFGALCFFAGLFLAAGQLVWGVIDVIVSRHHSDGTKAAIILLTFLLLGPIMTFFYACFGTRSRALRRATVGSLIVMLISGASVVALARVHGGTQAQLADLIDRDKPTNKNDATAFQQDGANTMDASDLDMKDFKAVHYVPLSPQKWSVSLSDFNLSGVVKDSGVAVTVPSIYPLNQIAVDPRTGRTYAITTHRFGYIVPATGHFVDIETDPSLPELSWPSAIAFDEAHERVIVVGRSAAFSYDPKTGAWEIKPAFADLGLISLTYDAHDGVFFGLVSELGKDGIDSIVRLDDNGSVLSVIRLTQTLAADGIPSGRIQLRKPGRYLVILVSSHYKSRGGETKLIEQRMALVDPESGTVATVRP